MQFLKELLYTFKSRKYKGDLSLWEFHIYRQYKKYVFDKVKPDTNNIVLVQCDGFISEMEIQNSDTAAIERHKKHIINHMVCQIGEYMWEKGLISVTAQEKADCLAGIKFVAKAYCIKKDGVK